MDNIDAPKELLLWSHYSNLDVVISKIEFQKHIAAIMHHRIFFIVNNC